MSSNIYDTDKSSKKGYDDFLNFVNSLKVSPNQLNSAEKPKEGNKRTHNTTEFISKKSPRHYQIKTNMPYKPQINLPLLNFNNTNSSNSNNNSSKLNKSKSFGKSKTPIKIRPSSGFGLANSLNRNTNNNNNYHHNEYVNNIHVGQERKSLFKQKDRDKEKDRERDFSQTSPMIFLNQLERAAIIIQTHFRGYLSRRKAKKMKNNKVLANSKVKKNYLEIDKRKDTASNIKKNNRNHHSEKEKSNTDNNYNNILCISNESKSFNSEISNYSLNTNSIDLSSEGDSIELI